MNVSSITNKVNCPHCSSHLVSRLEYAGKTVRCPSCKNTLKIPFPELEAYVPMARIVRDREPPEYEDDEPESSKRILAGVMGMLLGALGIHKFVLGYTGAGVIMLLVSIGGCLLFFIGPMVMGIIGFIEGIIYLTMTEKDFKKTHGRQRRPWF